MATVYQFPETALVMYTPSKKECAFFVNLGPIDCFLCQ